MFKKTSGKHPSQNVQRLKLNERYDNGTDEEMSAANSLIENHAQDYPLESWHKIESRLMCAGARYRQKEVAISEAAYDLVSIVTTACRYIICNDKQESVRAELAKLGYKGHDSGHIANVLLRRYVSNDPKRDQMRRANVNDQIYRMSMTVRDCLLNQIPDDKIREYIKKNGGMSGAIERSQQHLETHARKLLASQASPGRGTQINEDDGFGAEEEDDGFGNGPGSVGLRADVEDDGFSNGAGSSDDDGFGADVEDDGFGNTARAGTSPPAPSVSSRPVLEGRTKAQRLRMSPTTAEDLAELNAWNVARIAIFCYPGPKGGWKALRAFSADGLQGNLPKIIWPSPTPTPAKRPAKRPLPGYQSLKGKRQRMIAKKGKRPPSSDGR